MNKPKAILFDVFGTLVDWRGSLISGFGAFGAARNIEADWADVADSWRRAYKPSMERVRRRVIPWTILDDLHRDSLIDLARRFEFGPLSNHDCRELIGLWHRLAPWPDSQPGLTRLKTRHIIGPLSNGHLALQVALAKRNGFPWDVVFGADLFRHYKPDAEVYLGACDLLSLDPGEVMLAAAHNDDLRTAQTCGLRTSFISRPREYGDATDDRAQPNANWDIVAGSVEDLASQLGC